MSEEEILNIEVDEFLSSKEFKSSRPKIIGVDIGVNAKGSQMRYWVATDMEINDEIKKYIEIKDNKLIITNHDIAKSIKIKPYKKMCTCCGTWFEDKQIKNSWSKGGEINLNFYQDYETIETDNYVNICKSCLFSMCDDSDGVINQKKLIKALMRYNKVYNHKKYENLFKKKESSKNYFSSLSSLTGQREKGFLESDKEAFKILIEMAKEENSKLDFNISRDDIEGNQEIDIVKDNFEDETKKSNTVIERWGAKLAENSEAIKFLEKTYKNYKNNFDVDLVKYENDIRELCKDEYELFKNEFEEAKDRKATQESVSNQKQRLKLRPIDNKDAQENVSLTFCDIFSMSEKHNLVMNVKEIDEFRGLPVDEAEAILLNLHNYHRMLDDKDPIDKIELLYPPLTDENYVKMKKKRTPNFTPNVEEIAEVIEENLTV